MCVFKFKKNKTLQCKSQKISRRPQKPRQGEQLIHNVLCVVKRLSSTKTIDVFDIKKIQVKSLSTVQMQAIMTALLISYSSVVLQRRFIKYQIMIRNYTINYYCIELKMLPDLQCRDSGTTYEAIEAIASVKFVATLKIAVHSLRFLK